MNALRSIKGFSLLEVILALAIAGMIILMGFRFYTYYTFRDNIGYIQENVETLLNAAALFYRANCASTLDTTTTPYVVNLTSQFITPRYLTSKWEVQTLNPLVDNSYTAGGFIVQFNLLPTSAVMNVACSSSDCSQTASPKIYPKALDSSLVPLLWEIQVSVKVGPNVSSGQMTAILNTTGATCLSNLTGTSVNTCRSPGSGPFQWISWTQLPSFASPHSLTPYWGMMPMVKQFNLQYTHDQMYELTSQTYSNNGNGHAQGYYTCGD